MNQRQKDFMDIYLTNSICFIEEEKDYHAFDYLELLQENLEELEIPYTKKEWQEMIEHIVTQLQKEFGKQNVYASKEKNQIIIVKGKEKKIHAQMVVVKD